MLMQALIGLALAAPTLLIGYFGLRRSLQADKVAAQAGLATVESGTVTQAITGLNSLVDRLQTDNTILRERIDACTERLADVLRHCEDLKRELAELRASLSPRDRMAPPSTD